MRNFDIDFGFFSYLVDWLGFTTADDASGSSANVTASMPIG